MHPSHFALLVVPTYNCKSACGLLRSILGRLTYLGPDFIPVNLYGMLDSGWLTFVTKRRSQLMLRYFISSVFLADSHISLCVYC
jgi:hypothetical protein